jgi:uncharacterized protein (TIGR00645 family)
VSNNDPRSSAPDRRTVRSGISGLIFFSRWLQAPLYVGLILAQVIYVVVFVIDLWHLWQNVSKNWTHIDESTIMLSVLGLIDVVMIANLLIMVIIGGYETFVSRIHTDGHPDQPEWLSHVNANVLKVKLAMAIIGISSIHLLQTFIAVSDIGAKGGGTISDSTGVIRYTTQGVMWQVIIHLVFVISAIALALIDRMSSPRTRPGRTEPGFAEVGSNSDSGNVTALRVNDDVLMPK